MVKFLDLFAGCGGFSAGLRRAGLHGVGKLEIDEWAAATLRANFPQSEVLQADIRTIPDSKIETFRGVDVIVGGPPCQGFSVAGGTQFGIHDPRNELFHWFLHWVEVLRPRIAVVENVPTILTKVQDGGTVLDAVRERLGSLGYTVQAQILNAADYGTPQARRRAFIVASANGVNFAYPAPTHSPPGNGDLFGPTLRYQTVGEALSDLPTLKAGEGTDELVPYATKAGCDYQRYAREGSVGVRNHIAMRHTSRLVERFKVIQPGQSLKDVPVEHGQVAKLTGEKVKKPFGYNNYRLDPHLPALTIPASFQSLFLHPVEHRNLTAREAARIMGFTDDFVFMGKRTTMSWEKNLSQYNQIGNAVCPPVGEALGRQIVAALREAGSRDESATSDSRTRPLQLRGAERIPRIEAQIPDALRLALMELGRAWSNSSAEFVSLQGLRVPLELLPAAILIASEHDCSVCSPDAQPFGRHGNSICFLISKDDVQSLRQNGQDHGLDYHLRAIFGVDHQVAHLVGELLDRIGLAEVVELVNERTGRKVRGLIATDPSAVPPSLRTQWRSELRRVVKVEPELARSCVA